MKLSSSRGALHLQVNVRPAQSKKLAASHTGGHSDKDWNIETSSFRCVHQCRDLILIEYLDLA